LAGRVKGIYISREGLAEFNLNYDYNLVCVLSLSKKMVEAEEIEFR
jgi:hypothetical protein